jgi:rubrerythrin
MEQTGALDILKSALILERRGKAFYAQVAKQAQTAAVKDFFELMVAEEDEHIRLLSEQYKSFHSEGAFAPVEMDVSPSSELASEVLGKKLKESIAAADFEAAAISAAISMEKEAIRVYSERAAATSDAQERELYQWLADWEVKHLDFLAKINRELIEEVWNDNHFWPL